MEPGIACKILGAVLWGIRRMTDVGWLPAGFSPEADIRRTESAQVVEYRNLNQKQEPPPSTINGRPARIVESLINNKTLRRSVQSGIELFGLSSSSPNLAASPAATNNPRRLLPPDLLSVAQRRLSRP